MLLSGSAGNRINNTAGFTTTGGTIRLSGGPSFTETVGSLSLGTGTSVIDLGTMGGTNVLTFANSSASTWTGTLQVWNWSGSIAGGGLDQLSFGASGLTAGQVSGVSFVDPIGFSTGTYGATLLGNGELVPVPEPGALVSAAALGVAAFFRRRRTNVEG